MSNMASTNHLDSSSQSLAREDVTHPRLHDQSAKRYSEATSSPHARWSQGIYRFEMRFDVSLREVSLVACIMSQCRERGRRRMSC